MTCLATSLSSSSTNHNEQQLQQPASVTAAEEVQFPLEKPPDNMLDRITDDLNFLLNGSSEDMITFTPAHQFYSGGGCTSAGGGKQKLTTIQETMVGISEEFELRNSNSGGGGGNSHPSAGPPHQCVE